jgi:hypothetical protein
VIATESNHPHADAWSIVLTVFNLVPQFLVVAATPPFWISPIVAALTVFGAIGLYRERRRLLWLLLGALALMFVPLGRYLGHDELLGARYFLPALPLLFLVAGLGLDRVLKRATSARAGTALFVVPLVASAALSAPALMTHYTFQDEYRFLRTELAALPQGCTVYSLPVRDDDFGRDLDVALDVAHSPLRLAYPGLKFVALSDREPPPSGGTCAAYYQSALCSITETQEVRERFANAYGIERRRCKGASARAGDHPFAEARVSARGVNDVFGGKPPRVALYRLW